MNIKVTTHLINLLVWSSLALVIIIGAFVFYLLFVQDNPPSRVELPMNAKVLSDGKLLVEAQICRYTYSDATLYITYKNTTTGLLHRMAPREVNSLPVGCHSVSMTETLPRLEPGEYIRYSKMEYHVNILADRTIELYTEPFVVGE